jgi:hypothetical protein
MSSRVKLYVRQGCHLCDDAKVVVASVCDVEGVAWSEHDIDHDEALRARFSDDIPVVTVDDAVVGFWRIDPQILRSAIRST